MLDEEQLRIVLLDLRSTQQVHEGVLTSLTDAVRRLYDASGNGHKWEEMLERLDGELATARAMTAPNVVQLDGFNSDRAADVLQRIRDMLAGE